ncbi:helix-turn-helix domain-containing protein [Nitrospinaceae bacterium]|nr:helix-turn-helix domain-containing protein [Nitrospinaceae bacterium]
MSNFAERLGQAMFDKHYKAVDVVRGTKIGASVISKYLSGMNQPSRDNLFALGKFLEVTPEWLLSSSDAPESKKPGHNISTHKDKIIELQEQLIADKVKQIDWLSKSCDDLGDEVRRLEAHVGMLKAQNDQWLARSEARHPKGSEKAKHPNTPHKEMVEYLKKNKPKK